MTFKSFLIGMLASFGSAWLFVIAIPTAKMGSLEPLKMSAEADAEYYQRKTSGRLLNGSEIYSANACYACHTQLIRPTTLGREIWRVDSAGICDPAVRLDTRRETSPYDFQGEAYAQIGINRMGQDLSNFGYRAEVYAEAAGMTPEMWVLSHLYQPRNSALHIGDGGQKINVSWSNCPSQPQMFDKTPLNGQGSKLAIATDLEDETQIIPSEQAIVLTNYLLSLKRDDALPEKLDHSPKQLEGADSN